MSDLAEQIRGIVEAYLAAEGVELDDVEILGGGKLLRVTVDAEGPLELEHIAALSRGIGRLIEEEDPVASSYTLEVTSPGLERKLRHPAQFLKAVGGEVAVKTYTRIDDDKHHKGRLITANGDGITVDVGGKERSIAYGDVASARTVFIWEKGQKPGKTAVSEA